MPDLFGNLSPDDQGKLFAPQTRPSEPATYLQRIALPAPSPTPTEAREEVARYRRWRRRPWAQPDATDKRIAKQYHDTDSTGELL